jgi:hypothetical protein
MTWRSRGAWSAAAVWVVAAGAAAAAHQEPASIGLYGGPSAAALVAEGVLATAPADAASYEPVPAPGLRSVRNEAQATVAPWVDSNGWRFKRGLRRANYEKLPAGAGPLAAAEAFAFGVDAILHPDAADLQELGRMVTFLRSRGRLALPPLANIGVIDDGTPVMGEVLNMLTRRNLLYRVVPPGDRSLDVTMEVGTPAYPRDRLRDPSDLAARAREALGDDRRLVRVYGTSTVIAHLTGDASRVRLALLSYSRNGSQPSIRIRVRGRFAAASLAAFGAPPEAPLEDVRHPEGAAIEFSLPPFTTIAIVDLDRAR